MADVRRRWGRLGLVAPSGCLPDPAVADRAAARLSRRGWDVVAGESVFSRHQRFAGPDDLRARELQAFSIDPGLDAVLVARGGYGMSRLLDRLDFRAIARARRPIVGYSDFTAFHLALMSAGGISFAGPGASDFAAPRPDRFTLEQFEAVLASDGHELRFDCEGTERISVRGRLWGGNLTMVASLCGTRWMPAVRGGLLFLEDVNEAAYRIERLLYQLWHAGILARQRAIILGSFDPVPRMATDDGYRLSSAIEHIRSRLRIPVITGLPFGHQRRKATLPVGAMATLEVRGGQASLSFRGYPRVA
ncbi:MAG: LD-carboxypeptidase [Pseudomonadota bacterium]